MFGITNFETFLFAGIILNLTPGADTMYILGRSISQGKKAGIMSALGISTGSLVHCIIASFGLSIIIAKSAIAFSTIKYLGAVYLIYLGVKALLTKSRKEFEIEQLDKKKSSNRKIFISGILTNILNPKVALFFFGILTTIHWPELCNEFIAIYNSRIDIYCDGNNLVLGFGNVFGKIVGQNPKELQNQNVVGQNNGWNIHCIGNKISTLKKITVANNGSYEKP